MTPVRRLRARPWPTAGQVLLGALVAACESPAAPTACGPLPQVTVHAGETVSVTACFNDPNGDALGYALTSSNPSVATVSLAGSVVNVDAVAPGSATITVTARDAGGLQGQASFGVVVPNRPPRARGSIPAQRVEVGSEVVVDLASWFEDPDGESLAFRVIPSDAAVVEVTLSGTRVTLAGLAKGVADITATATDPGGLAAVQTFRFEVPNRGPAAVGVIEGQVMDRGETVGQAYFCGLRSASRLPYSGFMEFDAADLAWMEERGILENVILHEMGHVLGVGSLWDRHGLLRNPSLTAGREVDTHFAGAKTIRAFDEVGGASYTGGAKVPVENKGTERGSDDSHWRKNIFANELMNPSVKPVMPVSAVTLASLADLGYAVRMELADAYRLPGAAAQLVHKQRAIPLGDDVLRIPVEVRDENGRVVGVIPP